VHAKETFVAGDFLDTLCVEERQRIKNRATILAEMLEEWVRKYPLMCTVRIPAIALLTATALPRIPPSSAVLASQVVLWVGGVDDRADERMTTLAEMQRKREEWYTIANNGCCNGTIDDELTAILVEIRGELSRFALFERLRVHWASSVKSLVEAMAQEYQYALQFDAQGIRALPSLDEYLRTGRQSIGIYLGQSTALILQNDSSVGQYLEPICEATRYAGAAVRLYNDVQTFDKEIQEGGINAVLIRCRGRPDSQNVVRAREYTLQLADAYAQRCYDLVGQIQTRSRQFEELICRSVAFHSLLYREHDYHTTSMAEVTELFDMNR
jgi:hypothetical protein